MEQRRLSESLDRLDPVDRAVLELSKRRGMSGDDIASVMRSTPEAVARRLRNAVDRVTVWTGGSTSDDRRAVDRELDRLLSVDRTAPVQPAVGSTPRPGAPASLRETPSRRGTAARGERPVHSAPPAPASSPAPASASGETEARPSWVVVIVMAIVLALIGAAIGYGLSAVAQEAAVLPGEVAGAQLVG